MKSAMDRRDFLQGTGWMSLAAVAAGLAHDVRPYDVGRCCVPIYLRQMSGGGGPGGH